jgi:hypothetical protein
MRGEHGERPMPTTATLSSDHRSVTGRMLRSCNSAVRVAARSTNIGAGSESARPPRRLAASRQT